jgi:ComF family protein
MAWPHHWRSASCLIPNPQSLIPEVLKGADGVIAALFAPACAVCDRLLDTPLSGCVCASCWIAVRPITPPMCDRCGDPLPRSDGHCPACSGPSSAITRARAIGEYEGTLREIIHAFKYSGRLSLAPRLAKRMRQRAGGLMGEVDCVVPVPLHWRREYQRGFNQALELARHLGPPVVDVLRRRRATRAQVELAAGQRRANVAGAFAIRKHRFRDPAIRGKNVLLIDDVSTTGATLEACAHVLKESGASAVSALTAARVITRRRHDSANPESPIPDP